MLKAWIWKSTYPTLGLSIQCLLPYSGKRYPEVGFCSTVSFSFFALQFSYGVFLSKLGVPIKTTISANVLEEALNGTVTVRPLPVGTSVNGKVIA